MGELTMLAKILASLRLAAARLWALALSEPVAAQALMQTTLALVCGFGVHLSVEQVGEILALSAAVLGFLTRRAVSPTAAAALPAAESPTPQP